MPRRPREDIRPKVRIKSHPQMDEIEALLDPYKMRGFRVTIAMHDPTVAGSFFFIYDDFFSDFINWCEKEKLKNPNIADLDGTILLKLMLRISRAKIFPVSKKDPETGTRIYDENLEGRLYTMMEVGCRVKHNGILALAKEIGVSKSALEKQIRLYRSADLVVNSMKATSRKEGFIEFNALVLWKGKLEYRDAYLNVKSVPFPIVFNSEQILE